jgi:hypothetical protein
MWHIALLELCTHKRVLCVCVWVNRNGYHLESVKISGSHSGDCDDYCCRAATPCSLLDWHCCFGGTSLRYIKKGPWCLEGGRGVRQNLIFVPRRLGQQIPPTRSYWTVQHHLPEEGSIQNWESQGDLVVVVSVITNTVCKCFKMWSVCMCNWLKNEHLLL